MLTPNRAVSSLKVRRGLLTVKKSRIFAARATDWMAGSLYRLDAEGGAETVLELGQGTADLEFIEGESLAVIPMMMDGAVAAYKVE